MAVNNAILLLTPGLLLVPILCVQYVTCIVAAMGRVGLWASFFAFTAAKFGFKHYGKLIGTGMLIQGCSGLLKFPLLLLCLGQKSYQIANVIFLGLGGLEFFTILTLRQYLTMKVVTKPLLSNDGATQPQDLELTINK